MSRQSPQQEYCRGRLILKDNEINSLGVPEFTNFYQNMFSGGLPVKCGFMINVSNLPQSTRRTPRKPYKALRTLRSHRTCARCKCRGSNTNHTMRKTIEFLHGEIITQISLSLISQLPSFSCYRTSARRQELAISQLRYPQSISNPAF